MARKVSRFAYWAPRVLGLVFVAFLMLFSLDIFDMNLGFWETVLGLFMHNIPALILLGVVIISWKHEIVGGIVFILFGLAYIAFATTRVGWYLALSWSLIIAGPAILTGILFLMNWKRKKKKRK